MKIQILTLFLLLSLSSMAQDPVLWKLYNADGTETTYANMIKTMSEADVIFLGEEHNNSLAHWIQMQIVQDLYKVAQNNLVVGFEMFEADNQLVLDEYMQGLIPADKFETDVRFWNNYKTDYKPILEFSKKNSLKVVATNVPRRYAARVNKDGGLESLEKLSKDAQKFIAPLPIKFDEKFYLSLFEAMMGHGSAMGKETGKEGEVDKKLLYMSQAQAIKDATMAYFLLENMKKDSKFIHLNGNLHSDNFQGVPAYVKDQNKKLKIVTLSTVSAENPGQFQSENKNQATFLFYVNSTAPKSY